MFVYSKGKWRLSETLLLGVNYIQQNWIFSFFGLEEKHLSMNRQIPWNSVIIFRREKYNRF